MSFVLVRRFALALPIVAAGCASVSPPPDDLATQHVGVPARFAEFLPEGAAPDVLASGWVAQFNDDVLESLVREAWAKNPDLYVAAARFDEAAARIRIAGSLLYPQVNGVGGASHTTIDDGTNDSEFFAGLQVSWEADLWGRLRSNRAAAANIAASAGLDYVQARHSLAAAVAEAYFAVITAKQRLAIDQLLLDAERFTAVTTGQRVEAGLGTTLDADLAESSVRLAEAAVQNDLAAIDEAKRALELLLGRYPAAEIETAVSQVPRVPADPIDVGVPTALLERRPDVRSAEAVVDAAYYDVRSARAAQLPRLVLTADATMALDPSEFIAAVAGNIVAPIFQGGRLKAEEAAANARQQQAIGQFASVALRAFREVESALSNARYLAEREVRLTEASERLQRASEAAINRYEQGLLTILDLQQVRRQDFETRLLLLGVRFEQLRQRLDLYLALGGPVVASDAATDETSPAEQPDADSTEPMARELHVGEDVQPANNTGNENGDAELELDDER